MIRRPIAAWILFLSGFLAGPGCATLEHEVSVTLADVRFGGATALESTLLVSVRITNAQPVPLVLAGGVHDLEVNGLTVGRGVTNEPLTVPALGSAVQQVPLYASNLRLATRLRPILESRSFAYRLRTRLERSGGGSLSASAEGRLGADDLPPGAIAPPPRTAPAPAEPVPPGTGGRT